MDKHLSSKPIVEELYKNMKLIVPILKDAPSLSIILIDDRDDSKIYVNMKKKKCLELGIECNVYSYDNTISENIIIKKIKYLNNDDSVSGIMVQLPLPKHLNTENILSEIDEKKDVDGLHLNNLGKIMNNYEPYFYPCTPLSVIKLLEYYKIDVVGKNIVFVGTGMVNLPLSLMMLNKKATIIMCNEYTEYIKEKTILADILIVACGQSKIIKKDWIKEDVIIIDIGIHKNDGKINGDVDYLDVINKVKYITPVPGGVGPLTVCLLMNNCIKSKL